MTSAAEPQWSYDTKNTITGLAISGDGESIAAGTANNNLFYFNQNGTLLWTRQSVQKISSISLPVNGQYVGVGGTNIAIFRSNGESLFMFNSGTPIKDVQFFPDGKYIALMDLDEISLYTREGGQVWTYSVKGDTTTRDLDYHHHIAVSDDGTTIIFSPPWAKKLYCVTVSGNYKWVTPLDGFPLSTAMSSNGNYVLVGTDNKTLSLITSQGKIQWVKDASEPVTSVALTFDGSYIVYGGKENIVNFIKNDGSLLWKQDLFSQIDALAVTQNGSYVIAATVDKRIHVFKSSGNEQWQYALGGRINDIRLSDNGEYFVVGTDDGKIYLFSIEGLPAPIVIAETIVPTPVHTQNFTPLQTVPETPHPQENSNQGLIIGVSVVVLIIATGASLYYIYLRKMVRARKSESSTFPKSLSYSHADEKDKASSEKGIHHDVFISHSSKDKTTGDAVCAALESHSVRCWIAPRDIRPGKDYPEEIMNAIDDSRIMVLIYSAHANESPHVTRELTGAVSKNVIIIPFRIEDAPLSKSMEYLIGLPHWLDALTPPLEQHIDTLVRRVKALMDEQK